MGVMSNTSETVITHPREVVYDYASNPTTWGKNYKGSGGMVGEEEMHKDLPLKVGYTWTEKVTLPPNTYHSTWTLITAVRPFKWAIQQINGIGKLPDGTGGVDGICTITYTFEEAGPGQCLFRRNLTCELPKGVDCADDLLTVMARPAGIDRYHANIQKQLDEAAGK
ncbi:hypothetical protein Z517_04152 [Fonsecaea pedrosoi CBS 271.37]|uniref:Uncharacterized protein n=1 Tax=Fonsecaea pedrosoi CBS 271.37 TaxID=1442368 RepID=A0A0D2H979_9EURO|nr:uncharacterized protein Z517_04152 [Fonsecaea pedrosoi CBS 271.37]KAH0836945.1 polyketide cyclase dehydrase and lipid transport [Fonsecaea pedrosoi]KIW81129.1 hypothetical protein Z517_04152 [Fonsecaea pedrosoi CBS 271.37]